MLCRPLFGLILKLESESENGNGTSFAVMSMVFRNRTKRYPFRAVLPFVCAAVETNDFKRKAICVPPLALR